MDCHFCSLFRHGKTTVSIKFYLYHNYFNLNFSPIFVDYGSIKLYGGKTTKVKKVILHEEVNWLTGDYDIALLETDPMQLGTKTAQKINLPQSNIGLDVGRIVNISGWGRDAYEGQNSPDLKYGSIEVLTQDKCKEGYPQLTERQFCAGDFELGTTDFCYGDYGGPAANWDVLYGIQSTHKDRFKCGLPRQPGIYTNVSQFVDWIHGKINTNN